MQMLEVIFLQLQDQVIHLQTQTQWVKGIPVKNIIKNLNGRYHGAESKDGGVVLDSGKSVKCSLSIQQQHGDLQGSKVKGQSYGGDVINWILPLLQTAVW